MLHCVSNQSAHTHTHTPHTHTHALQYADGSGGNGSALRHFEATGSKYPLVVKLGTITPAGADVYSYTRECVRCVRAARVCVWGGGGAGACVGDVVRSGEPARPQT
jgi:hypothetical protein